VGKNKAGPGHARDCLASASTAVVPAHIHARSKAEATPTPNYIFSTPENTNVNKTTQNPLRGNQRVAKLLLIL
jgi:hypothetical protein